MQKSDQLVKSVALQSMKCAFLGATFFMWAFSTKLIFALNSVPF